MQCTVLTLSSAGSSHGEVRPRYALRYTAASRRQRTRGAPPPAGRFQKARCACRVALGPHGGVDGTRRVAASGPTEPTAPSAAGHPGTTSDCHEAPGLQLLLAFRQVACTPTWILPALRRRRFNPVGSHPNVQNPRRRRPRAHKGTPDQAQVELIQSLQII